jgi:hypothetical protein
MMVLTTYNWKQKTINIFVSFELNKIKMSRGIDQFQLGFGAYDLYAIVYGLYGHR